MIAREEVIAIIRELSESVGSSESPRLQAGVRRGDGRALESELAEVCARHGLEPAEYHAALATDAALQELERAALGEATVGSTDPGPYDAISREDSLGRPRTPGTNQD
jgi:hypothetical protein